MGWLSLSFSKDEKVSFSEFVHSERPGVWSLHSRRDLIEVVGPYGGVFGSILLHKHMG